MQAPNTQRGNDTMLLPRGWGWDLSRPLLHLQKLVHPEGFKEHYGVCLNLKSNAIKDTLSLTPLKTLPFILKPTFPTVVDISETVLEVFL